MSQSLFNAPWFSRMAFDGVHKALHGSNEEVLSQEGSFMSQLLLQVLDWQRSGELFNAGLYDFFAFCQQRLSRSHSQVLQDLWVLYMLKEKHEGFFVEFGACDGVKLSNTLLLERDYGWTGILAEPDPVWHEALAQNRSCSISHKCLFATTGAHIPFSHISSTPELSHISEIAPNDVHERNGIRSKAEIIEVETISLLDLLRQYNAPNVIDYLSSDTEGSELNIFEAFDFAAYQFRLISIEHAGEASKRERIRQLLEPHGYRRWRPELSRWDDWYWQSEI